MSHNTISVNSSTPSASGLISPQTPRASHYSTSVSVTMGSVAGSAGQAYSWRIIGQAVLVLSTGFSVGLSPRRNPVVYTSDWYELVNVPAGNWWVEIKIGSSQAAPTGARVALYRNDTGAIVSNIVSFRDNNRCAVMVARIAGDTSYEVRIVSGSMNIVGTDRAFGVSGWHFKRID